MRMHAQITFDFFAGSDNATAAVLEYETIVYFDISLYSLVIFMIVHTGPLIHTLFLVFIDHSFKFARRNHK